MEIPRRFICKLSFDDVNLPYLQSYAFLFIRFSYLFSGIEMRRIILLFFVALSPILSLPVTKTTKKPVDDPADLQVQKHSYEGFLSDRN